MCMFYIIVNTKAPLNGQDRDLVVTGKQTSKPDVLMDVGQHAHGFLDKTALTVLLSCRFLYDVLLIFNAF